MPLPHMKIKPKLIGTCKYCKKDIYAFDQWRIEHIDNMKEHIKNNGCKSLYREERFKELLDDNSKS